MERKQAYGRTITTAPIQDSRSRPAQSATADFSGVAEFGRALQGMGGQGMRVAGGIQNEYDRMAAEQKTNLTKQTLSMLDVSLRESVLHAQMTTEGWGLMDDRQRAQVLTPIVKDWEKRSQTLAQERAIEIPPEWVADKALDYTVPSLQQGQMVRSANMLSERMETEMKNLNLRINTTGTVADLLTTAEAAPNGFASVSNTYLSHDSRQAIIKAGWRHAAERALSFAKDGAITEEQIDSGLKKGIWDNSQADAMRAALVTGKEQHSTLTVTNYNKGLESMEEGTVTLEEAHFTPAVTAMAQKIVRDGKGDVVATNMALNTMGREVQLAAVTGQLSEALLNNKGLSYGVVHWRQVQDMLAKLNEPEGRREFFAPFIKDAKFGEYTDKELAKTASALSTNYTKWVKEIQSGRAHVKFSNDVLVQDFVRKNPEWMNTEGGWQAYTKVMRQVQEGAGIPSQYISPVPTEVMNMFKEAALKPEKLGSVLSRAVHPTGGLGREMNSLVQGLSADAEFMKSSNGQVLVGGLVPVALAMNMEKDDKNMNTVMEMTAALAQTVNFINQGGEQTFNEAVPNGKETLQKVAVVMDGNLAKNAGKIRDAKQLPLYAEGLDSYNNLISGLSVTYTPEVALAVSKAITFDAMRRSNGNASRLAQAYAESYSAMTAGMKVVIANGTQRSGSSMEYIVVPASSEPRGFMHQPDGTTIGTDNDVDYGTTTSLTLDVFSAPSFPVLEPMATAPATTAAMKAMSPFSVPTGLNNPFLAPQTLGVAMAVDYFRGKAPWGAMESMWNDVKSGLAQNWFGVSVENSRTPALSLLNADPELMDAIPSVFRPDAGRLVLEGFDKNGRETLIPIATGKPIPRSLVGEAKQVFADAVQGYSTAKDRDLRALTVAQNITWRYNKTDDMFYAFLKPGRSDDGQIVLPVQGGAPQQLFQVVNGVKLPMAVPKVVIDKFTAAKEARSGSFMSSAVSASGNIRRSVEFSASLYSPELNRVPADQLKATLQKEADVFVRTHMKQ